MSESANDPNVDQKAQEALQDLVFLTRGMIVPSSLVTVLKIPQASCNSAPETWMMRYALSTECFPRSQQTWSHFWGR